MSKLLVAEDALWKVADKLRGRMNPTEYRPLVLGLIFLRAVSEGAAPTQGSEKALDEQISLEVPPQARWEQVQGREDLPVAVDDAMTALESANPILAGAVPKGYAQAGLAGPVLRDLFDLLSAVELRPEGASRTDVLGRIYEYFLGRFAATAGRGDGEFYTPPSVVELLVEMLQPFAGKVYDPCSGSGGMFVQVERFVEAHGQSPGRLAICGQEMNPSTWRLARLNLAVHGLDGNLGDRPADTFAEDLHPDLRADYILANPPFNVSEWGGNALANDSRWQWGLPPATNANYAWLQHMASKLADHGAAGIVLANGSLSSMQAEEHLIRQRLVEDDLVECVVALPAKLFYTTGIPACLWFLRRDRSADDGHVDRRRQLLFVDARQLGTMVSRVHRVLADDDVAKIADTYHAWRQGTPSYEDVPGFCASKSLSDVAAENFTLVPARYVGSAEDDVEALDPADVERALLHELAENVRLAQAVSEAMVTNDA